MIVYFVSSDTKPPFALACDEIDFESSFSSVFSTSVFGLTRYLL